MNSYHWSLVKIMKKLTKQFDCTVLKSATYNYNPNKEIGKLIVEYQSGLRYHYQNVALNSVNLLFENDEQYAFTAHNKYIDNMYPNKKKVYTEKWYKNIEAERKKQYLAKNSAARRIRKQKARDQKKKELRNA
jgi:hypothetical protein